MAARDLSDGRHEIAEGCLWLDPRELRPEAPRQVDRPPEIASGPVELFDGFDGDLLRRIAGGESIAGRNDRLAQSREDLGIVDRSTAEVG